jgi:16S rRNA (guanine527-N7)-methyltransferase
MKDREIIKSWLDNNKLPVEDKQIDLFLKHLALIESFSKRMNLVSRNDLPHLVERHLLDSLYALKVFEFPVKSGVADLGSGAGFPGIPIAIARPDLAIDLIESRRLKSLFLKEVVRSINLSNVEVIHDRWENINKSYDIVLIRAVYNKDNIEKEVLSRISPDGIVLHFAKYNQINILKSI